jgi:hypothetical protein
MKKVFQINLLGDAFDLKYELPTCLLQIFWSSVQKMRFFKLSALRYLNVFTCGPGPLIISGLEQLHNF